MTMELPDSTALRVAAIARRPRLAAPAARFADRLLSQLAEGQLTVKTPDHTTKTYGHPAPDGLAARITIADPGVYGLIAIRGALGAAEGYIAGMWDCDDPPSLVRILVRNQPTLERMDHRWGWLMRPLRLLADRVRSRDRSASRRDIYAHYDLGNEFFSLFLDPTMTYSCGLFETPNATMEQASIAKLDLACRKLQLSPSDHVLEIGTGWGSFAIHAACRYGCRITTTTISPSQASLARQRIEEAGLSDRVTVLEQDYRDLQGQYDKLVSIEMIEAVGAPQLDQYTAKCSDLLKPDGAMLLQSIVLADQYYDRAASRTDFLKKYIFPGSFLPSIRIISESLQKQTDMRIIGLDEIGLHYAETLRHWRDRFESNIDQIRGLGLDERFIRMWRWYFCYCEGTFAERRAGDVQILLMKPRCRLEWPPSAEAHTRVPSTSGVTPAGRTNGLIPTPHADSDADRAPCPA